MAVGTVSPSRAVVLLLFSSILTPLQRWSQDILNRSDPERRIATALRNPAPWAGQKGEKIATGELGTGVRRVPSTGRPGVGFSRRSGRRRVGGVEFAAEAGDALAGGFLGAGEKSKTSTETQRS